VTTNTVLLEENPVQVETLIDLEAIDALRTEWEALHASCPDADLFTTHGWVMSWIASFGERKALRIVTVRDHGTLIGLTPLVWTAIWRRPWFSLHHIHPEDRRFIPFTQRLGCVMPVRQLSVAANMQSGTIRGGSLCFPGSAERVLRATWTHLRGHRDWDVACLPGLRHEEQSVLVSALCESGLRVGANEATCTLFGFPVLPWETYYAGRRRHFRKRFKAAERILLSLGTPTFETATEPGRVATLVEEMYELAKQSWKETGRNAREVHLPLTVEAMVFYRALSVRYAEQERCPLVTVWLDGILVAAMLCVVEGDQLYLLQTYYSPRVAEASPGRFLIREIVQWAADHGVKHIDMNGNSGLVQMFADTAQVYDQAVIFQTSGYSGWLYRVGRLVQWLKQFRSGSKAKVVDREHEAEG
jgi:hypothetical protein